MRWLFVFIVAIVPLGGCYREIEVTTMGERLARHGGSRPLAPPFAQPAPERGKSLETPSGHGGGPLHECPAPDDDDDDDDEDADDGTLLPKHGVVPRRGHEDNI